VGVAQFLIIALALPQTCSIAIAQNEINFTPPGKFGIPEYNGTINFAFNGTYTLASLENETWNFVNLRLNYSHALENLEVSTQNSNITIISYRSTNTTSGNARLRYSVEGQGRQTFNIGLDPKGGEWSVVFDGVFMGEGDGWNASPDGTLTILGATSDVTIWYFVFPDSRRINENSNPPFYQQHSVAIVTSVALAMTVILTSAVRRKNKKHLENSG